MTVDENQPDDDQSVISMDLRAYERIDSDFSEENENANENSIEHYDLFTDDEHVYISYLQILDGIINAMNWELNVYPIIEINSNPRALTLQALNPNYILNEVNLPVYHQKSELYFIANKVKYLSD